MQSDSPIGKRWQAMRGRLDERQRRVFAGAEAQAIGRGGVSQVAAATGLARATVLAGLRELDTACELPPETRGTVPVRRSGNGRKPLTQKDPSLISDLLALIEPPVTEASQPALRWSCKSLRVLAEELRAGGHVVSHVVVGQLLQAEGFTLHCRKMSEHHQARDSSMQFKYIDATVRAALECGQPVIAVETMKRELAGPAGEGREEPPCICESGQVCGSGGDGVGRGARAGIYSKCRSPSWVSVGADQDTRAFAVETIRRWWYAIGQPSYSKARELTISVERGSGKVNHAELWKIALGGLAQETGLDIRVCLFPPGTSKWVKVERMFSSTTASWCAELRVSHEVIVSLIGRTARIDPEGVDVRVP